MSGGWLVEAGNDGKVRLANSGGDWYLKHPSPQGETKCIIRGDHNLSSADSPVTVEITVSKFVSAEDNGTNYLFAELASGNTEAESTDLDSESDTIETQPENSTDSNLLPLSSLSGSGEYFSVEAVIDEIFWVRKDEQHVPDIAGAVRDEKNRERQMFVVNDGVTHPYLEVGRKFVFQNIKDHYYDNGDKVQMKITQHTDFTDKGLTSSSMSSSESISSPKKSSATESSKESKSLHQIANSMLGGKEFAMTQQRDSSIEKAKKKAKQQQRDPAIDPKLHDDR